MHAVIAVWTLFLGSLTHASSIANPQISHFLRVTPPACLKLADVKSIEVNKALDAGNKQGQ